MKLGQDDSWEETGHQGDAPWGVILRFPGAGYFVELKEINDEYYPVRSYGTWIS